MTVFAKANLIFVEDFKVHYDIVLHFIRRFKPNLLAKVAIKDFIIVVVVAIAIVTIIVVPINFCGTVHALFYDDDFRHEFAALFESTHQP